MDKSILIFISRILCYESNRFFIAEIEKELETLGFEVEICEIDLEDKEIEEKLMQYVEREFRAVIDFNSTLPRLELDSGERYLDLIHAPFYNYIVDHPLYHHPVIKLDLLSSNVICIDRVHAKFLKSHYPNVRNVVFMPLGAMEALNKIPYENRSIDVLFSGTYEPSKRIMEQIKESDSKDIILRLIHLLKSNIELTLEEGLKDIHRQEGKTYSKKEFTEILNGCYLADKYLRAYFREAVLHTLLESQIHVTVCGYGWEDFKCKDKSYLQIKEMVSFPVSLEMMADSKIVLNIMPWFKDGVHDRVLSAMVNEAICVTDTSAYLKENFTDGKHLIFYSLKELEKLPLKVRKLLENSAKAKEIISCGYELVKTKHMWKNRIYENIGLIN